MSITVNLQFPDVEAIRELSNKLDLVSQRLENMIMATKEEVTADLEEIKKLVTDTKGVAQSAVELITRLMGMIGDAAAKAEDLDAFRVSLKEISAGVTEEKDALAKAVEAAPK